jgi:hypothetical protein
MRRRKYAPGRRVRSLNELGRALARGDYLFLFQHGKPTHPGWVYSQHLRTILICLHSKDGIRIARRTDGTQEEDR